jgi:hypothetical protein
VSGALVRPSVAQLSITYKATQPTDKIFMKFGIRVFFKKLSNRCELHKGGRSFSPTSLKGAKDFPPVLSYFLAGAVGEVQCNQLQVLPPIFCKFRDSCFSESCNLLQKII